MEINVENENELIQVYIYNSCKSSEDQSGMDE